MKKEVRSLVITGCDVIYSRSYTLISNPPEEEGKEGGREEL
jgi:hypothetical protein